MFVFGCLGLRGQNNDGLAEPPEMSMIVPLSELAVDRRKSVGVSLERGENTEHIRVSRTPIVEGSRGGSQFIRAKSVPGAAPRSGISRTRARAHSSCGPRSTRQPRRSRAQKGLIGAPPGRVERRSRRAAVPQRRARSISASSPPGGHRGTEDLVDHDVIDAQLGQAAADALAAPPAQAALVGHVAARELGVVEQAVGGEALERLCDGLVVVPLLQQPPAELVTAAGAVPEQAVGVGDDAFGRRLAATAGRARRASSSRPWYRRQRATNESLTLQTKLPSTCTATWPRRVARSAVTTGTAGA